MKQAVFAPLALFLLLAAVPLPGQQARSPEEPDLLEIAPDQLAAADVGELVAAAHKAHGQERYEDAARAFIQALRLKPGDPGNLYNLACCYGLLGAEVQAARFLEAAWEAGFQHLDHIRDDPDFEKVRDGEAFRTVLDRLAALDEKKARERGRLLTLEATSVASVRVLEPPEMEPRKRYPLVIGLHGYGDSAERFAPLFLRREIEQPFLYCAPEAHYPFHTGDRVGYSWVLRGPEVGTSPYIRSGELSARYVLEVLEAVKREYRVDERNIFVLGFSQGAGLAFELGMRNPGLFRGVIPIGGWLDPAAYTRAQAESAAENLFLVCHSPEDRVVKWERCEEALAFLDEKEIPHRLVRYPGGHTLPAELIREVAAWIQEPSPGKPLTVKASPAGEKE
jgi:phospholipase/carboxylesterase